MYKLVPPVAALYQSITAPGDHALIVTVPLLPQCEIELPTPIGSYGMVGPSPVTHRRVVPTYVGNVLPRKGAS